MGNPDEITQRVNFTTPRSFTTILKSDLKETFLPDDPFRQFKQENSRLGRIKKGVQYFVPVFEWLPRYNLRMFRYDVLSGITIASLAIPQGISYAKLANLPPIIGLYCSFVPPLIYAVFGSSKVVAIGNVAAASLLLADIIEKAAPHNTDLTLYVSLIYTATLFTGIFQALLGFFRLGILVDFLSHSTIIGFMSGTATIISLQQLKGFLGLKHFTTNTDVISVLKAVFTRSSEWHWQSALVGVIFLSFLIITKEIKKRKPKLFWVSAISPILVVIVGCLFAYFTHSEKHGIAIVGELGKGINPLSINRLNFDSEYLPYTLKAGIITGILALAEGIAIGRSFALMTNDQIDGNKEMIAFGAMNIAGSLTSCYLTTGPFSKSAVNYNAGCKTAMSNVVMSLCLLFVLLFLAPIFKYTPLVALSAIIVAAMLGLIDYEEAYHLYKVDKFDFSICMAAFLGVAFVSMDIGLMLSVGLSVVRALLYVARPSITNNGKIPNTSMYRCMQQYPTATRIPGILILQLGSPVYFANSCYVRDRISRWIDDGQQVSNEGNDIEHVILDMGGVTSIDISGIEMLQEVCKNIERKGMKVAITNPRLEVTEKMILSKFVEDIGKDSVFLSVQDAVETCRFTLNEQKEKKCSTSLESGSS
ncbi:hypothetical protein GIB67_035445 [Kingdonia uniflora]|uniref:STAS domain-containing protein n=1 Tax=Kingdonia uniflora TaxID=39325 RepID=A0A7J7P0E6_9MAGN|nr:hypothetical protein GIB67_035445 [Kingdonia uniflora]